MWTKNCQMNSNTTVVYCIPHPDSIQQLHLCPCNATEGQVSARCEATTIHSSSPNISHLRLLLDGYLQHPNFVSTAIVQQLTPKSSTAIDAVSRKILTLRAKQNPNFLNNPRNCQARSCQSEWPLAEKGATRWWSLDPMELHATLRREHLQSSQSSVEFFMVSLAPWTLHEINPNSHILGVSFCSIL